MHSKLSAWCDALLELGWLTAVIVTPLFFNVHSDRVFEPDKLTLLRSIAIFMLAVWLVKVIDRADWSALQNGGGLPALLRSMWQRLARFPLGLPVLAIVISYLISTFFSVTPSVSWLGSYQRLQGTYTTLSYIIIFMITVLSIKDKVQVHRIVTTVIIVSIPVSLYGILQRSGLDPLPWGGNTVTRIAGHMGNAIFVGAYLIMVFPLTLGRIISSFTSILGDEELNVADVIRSSIYIFVLAIQLMAIYWTFSRGPLLGLLIGIFVFITIFLVSLRNSATEEATSGGRSFLAASFGFLLGLVALILAAYLRPTLGDLGSFGLSLGSILLSTLIIFILIALRVGWSWLWLAWIQLAVFAGLWLAVFNLSDQFPESVKSVPVIGETVEAFDAWRVLDGVGRYGTLLDSDSTTGKVRIFIWRGAVDLVLPHEPLVFPNGETDRFNVLRPFIGYGPESMYVAYNKFYPPELGTVEKRNASPDRSHNETWDALVITGLFGFIAWQWLYLAIFYYSFSWLGVVKTGRDRIMLILFWFLAGLIASVGLAAWGGPEFLGVGYPFGNIIGIIIYLIYYAIVARPEPGAQAGDPFQRDTLIMIATLGAIVAYFVEIHFGIAIASTRTHFFLYAAMLIGLGYILPETKEEEVEPVVVVDDAASQQEASEAETIRRQKEEEAQKKSKKKKGKTSKGRSKRERSRGRSRPTTRGGRTATVPDWLEPAAIWGYVLALMLTILGFNFLVYTPPPGLQIQSLADIPSAYAIFSQSMFVNASDNFIDSPFIYMLVIMSWLLGGLIALSEMAKNGYFRFSLTSFNREPNDRLISGLLGGIALIFVGLFVYGYFVAGIGSLSPMNRIGFVAISPIGALLCGIASYRLWIGEQNSRLVTAGVALAGVGMALPIMLAGGVGVWIGLILALFGLLILFLFWSKDVAQLIRPAAFVTFVSFGVGISFFFLHASRLRQSFITPDGVTAGTAEVIRRVAEADQFSTILTTFYLYLFVVMVIMSVVVARKWLTPPFAQGRNRSVPFGLAALVLLVPLAIFMIGRTNLRIIQADMIYKRGKPWDTQAARASDDPENAIRFWDNSIAIYERALELAPNEDFYYLWLGRAYLEKSAYLTGFEQNQILETAEAKLFEAQSINPLNTDHTANLARLNTRWATLESDRRGDLVAKADNFYQAAIDLSPQNSTIRNEYARMVYGFNQDCEEALDVYAASVEADPLYDQTRFQIAETAINCATRSEEAQRDDYYPIIVDSIEEGVELARNERGLAQRWLQAAQAFQQFEAPNYAIQAYEEALNYPNEQFPEWQIKYFLATAYSETGETGTAIDIATDSLEQAPPEVAPQIEQFIDELNAS